MSAGVLKSTAVRSMSAELPHEAVSRITRTAGRYTRFKTAITPPSVALDAEHADFAYLNAKDFFRQEKKSCSGVFSLCRCFLETILLFPTLRATFRRHIVRVHLNLGSGVLLSDHFQNDPARRRGAHGSLIEDQTLRSFFFELARVCGAAIATVGAPNNFR